MDWEKRSGVVFEGEKTVIIHFSRQPDRTSGRSFTIKGESIVPKETTKILGVIMDSQLRYKEHIAKTTTKGLLAAMALKGLRLVSPLTARRLFGATVAPVVDYASSVWMHACGSKGMNLMNRVQRVGAQAIIGAFRTVSVAVAEAEASIRTVRQRQAEKAATLWVNLRTLPLTNPLSKMGTRVCQRFTSLLQKITSTYQDMTMDRMEAIYPYVIAPWETRLLVTIDPGRERYPYTSSPVHGMQITTSSLVRRGMVWMGGAIYDSLGTTANRKSTVYSLTLGTREEQNAYTAELAAIAMAVKCLPVTLRGR